MTEGKCGSTSYSSPGNEDHATPLAIRDDSTRLAHARGMAPLVQPAQFNRALRMFLDALAEPCQAGGG